VVSPRIGALAVSTALSGANVGGGGASGMGTATAYNIFKRGFGTYLESGQFSDIVLVHRKHLCSSVISYAL
jgi:hypothetical protein